MDGKRSKVFNAHQGKFGSQWLNVVPCKNLDLKLDDQQLLISIGLRLGANICVAHTCHCGKSVERDGLHGLFAPRVLVASYVMILSILSLSRRWDLWTCLNARTAWSVTEMMANAQTVLP